MMKRLMGVLAAVVVVGGGVKAQDLRVGIIGLDTSHATAFTKMLNAEKPEPQYAGCRVTVAYPKGSADIESSVKRVPDYTKQVQALGVEIVDSIEALLTKCDVVLLETNDGRPHFEQALPVFKAGKRVFIDKPVAGTLADAIAIYAAAAKYKVPMFSSSSLRYTGKTQELRSSGKAGQVVGVSAYSPCSLEATHPDFFWYGVHGVEQLFTVMGCGCESVVRINTPGTDVAVGTWAGGRIGTFRGNRDSSSGYGLEAYMKKGVQRVDDFKGYGMLLEEIVKFFKTGVVPVPPEETIEIFAFMEAADESKRRGGVPVKIAEVMEKARVEADKRQY